MGSAVRGVTLLALAIAAALWSTGDAALPACCTDAFGTYNEADVLFSNPVNVTCKDCGPELTHLGTFPLLEAVGPPLTLVCINCTSLVSMLTFGSPIYEQVGSTPTITVQCIDCPALTTVGSVVSTNSQRLLLETTFVNCPLLSFFLQVPVLNVNSIVRFSCEGCATLPVALDLAALSASTGNLRIELSCTDCPALTVMLRLPASFETAPSATTILSLACVSCPQLETMVYASNLTILSGKNVMTCTNCDSVVRMVDLPRLRKLVNELHFTCINCPSLLQGVFFPEIEQISSAFYGTFVNNSALVGPLFTAPPTFSPISAIYIDCKHCPALTRVIEMTGNLLPSVGVRLEDVPSLTHLFSNSTVCLDPAHSTITCIDCIELVEFCASDVTLNELNSRPENVNHVCDNCPKLRRFGIFRESIFDSLVMKNWQFKCNNCPLLEEFLRIELPGEPAHVQKINATCLTCPSLRSFGHIGTVHLSDAVELTCIGCSSLEQGISLGIMERSATLLYTAVRVTCIDCPLLQTVIANMSSYRFPVNVLQSPLSYDGAWRLTCDGCTALRRFMPYIQPDLVPLDYAQSAGIFDCIGCTAFDDFTMPSRYRFHRSLPANMESFPIGAGLGLLNMAVTSEELTAAAPPVRSFQRVAEILLRNVSALADLDAYTALSRVDFAVTIEDCPDLASVDGLVVSLGATRSVQIENNPQLCIMDAVLERLAITAQLVPSITNNRNESDCSLPVLVRPDAPTALAVGPSSMKLGLALPQQPSPLAQYTLLINGLQVLSFGAWQRLDTYSASSLNQNTDYTIVLMVAFGNVILQSPPLRVTTLNRDEETCAQGYQRVATQPLTCLPCDTAHYSADGIACRACPPGTFATAGALTSSAGCRPCAAGTYSDADGSTACTPCDSAAYCRAGSSQSLSAASAWAASVTSSAAFSLATNNPTALSATQQAVYVGGLHFGFVYLIVFCAIVVISTPIFIALRNTLAPYFSPFAQVLRITVTLLRVGLPRPQSSRPFSLAARASRASNDALSSLNGSQDLHVRERRSYLRGVLGFWALVGIVLATIFQVHNFVLNHRIETSAVQSGTTFSSGDPVGEMTASLSGSLSLLGASFTCADIMNGGGGGGDALAVNWTVIDAATGTARALVFSCAAVDGMTAHDVRLSVAPQTISFGTGAEMRFAVMSASGAPVYCQAQQYELTLSSYAGTSTTMRSTQLPSNSSLILGGSVTKLSAVPTEYIDASIDATYGYSITLLSETLTELAAPEDHLVVAFEVSVQLYYLRISVFELITGLSFVTSLLAIGGGIVTAFSLLAFVALSFHRSFTKRWLKTESTKQEEGLIKLEATSSMTLRRS